MLQRSALMCVAIGALVGHVANAAELAQQYPRGTYVRVPAVARDEAAPPDNAKGQAGLVLFLNRCTDGETIYGGQDDSSNNTSSILGGSVNFPPFAYGDAAWNEVVDHTRAIMSPFNIQVTDVDPGAAAHDEAIVCGAGEDAGWGGAGGVAPFSCGIIPHAITFTFPDSLGGDPRTIAEVIAQEAAHAWGLDHEYLCEDPMTYLSGCGDKIYQDQDVSCGEYSPRSCDCGGPTQNSYQHIMNAFGTATPDTQAPTAAITYPSDGDAFEVGADFEIMVEASDDVSVTTATIFADGTSAGEDIAAPWGPWPVNAIPEGQHTFYLLVRDSAGNETQSDSITIVVNENGVPPGMDSDGASDGSSDDGGDDAGNDGHGGNDDDGGGFIESDGALPPGYGAAVGPSECSCTTTGPASTAWSLLVLLYLRRRRSRARDKVCVGGDSRACGSARACWRWSARALLQASPDLRLPKA